MLYYIFTMKKIILSITAAAIMLAGCSSVSKMDFTAMTPFEFFGAVSQIPRTSGNEQAVSGYLADFGRKLGLEVIQDGALNVFIRKNGAPGRENEPPVILQAHMDMVGGKTAGSNHDFLKDPIKLIIQGDRVTADGTTLGADNGAGLAYIMAILASSDISHPPIEALITTDEEQGMTGSEFFDVSLFNGRRFINLDSEEEGVFTVSSAASADVDIIVPVETLPMPLGFASYMLMIKELTGGHSGVDIDKGLANANVLMGRLLQELGGAGAAVSSINGGSQRNAIPRESAALISFSKNNMQTVQSIISRAEAAFKSAYPNDNNLEITLELTQAPQSVLSAGSLQRVLDGIMRTPNGVLSMNPDIEWLVQTSNNLGIVNTSPNTVTMLNMPRSSSVGEQAETLDKLRSLAGSIGAEAVIGSENPAWPLRVDSPLRNKMAEVFMGLYGAEPSIKAVHAGLECAVFAEKMPDGDFISIGPDISGAHSPDEWMSISSFNRVYEYLVRLLEKL